MKYTRYRGIEGQKEGSKLWSAFELQMKINKGQFMNEEEKLDEMFWKHLDGLGSPEERSFVEQLIATDPICREKYWQIQELHRLLSSQELEIPSLRFTKNVMEQIARNQVAPATRSYINKKIIWGIGGFFLAMILGTLVYGIGQINLNGAGTPDRYAAYAPKLDWGKIFSNTYINIFILINVVLGLVLLDMYLQRKKKLDDPVS